MKDHNKIKQKNRKTRQNRLRSKISGTPERPRLSVFRSLKHIRVQLIDDSKGATLASVSDAEIKAAKKTKTEIAKEVGKAMAEKAAKAGIKEAVFDRGGNRYHGRIKALAEGVREGGLKF